MSPTITFRVNLETLARQSFVQPSRTTTDGNETVSEADNMKNTRTLFIPGLLRNNYEGVGPTGYLHHGDEFTVSGLQAIYLKRTYVLGTSEDVLQIVSTS